MQIARAAARHQTPGRMARNRPAMPIELILDSMNRPPGKVMVKVYLLERSCLPQMGNGDREVLGAGSTILLQPITCAGECSASYATRTDVVARTSCCTHDITKADYAAAPNVPALSTTSRQQS